MVSRNPVGLRYQHSRLLACHSNAGWWKGKAQLAILSSDAKGENGQASKRVWAQSDDTTNASRITIDLTEVQVFQRVLKDHARLLHRACFFLNFGSGPEHTKVHLSTCAVQKKPEPLKRREDERQPVLMD